MPPAEYSDIFSEQDERFMRRALALAAKGRGAVEPNPLVGCVLARDGKTVAEGYHRKFGGPHAEVDALQQAHQAAGGATAYVTLEPCCHHGKTGPCCEALLEAGVQRVVAAMADPFPQVAGRGLQRLREAGVRVEVGLLEQQARLLNAPYLKRLSTSTPWVILKWAQSLDGKLATATGHSQWITSDLSRKEAHRLRGYVDAVLVGAGTVVADDPLLTCRMVKPRRIARRVVIDGRLHVPLHSQVVRTARESPVVIVCTEQAADEHRQKVDVLRDESCQVLPLPQTVAGQVDLKALLAWCGSQQMTNIMVEGGGYLLGEFLSARLADELAIFIAPMLIGGGMPIVPGSPNQIAPVLPPAGEPYATAFRSGSPLFPDENVEPPSKGERSAHVPLTSGPRGPDVPGILSVTPWSGGVQDVGSAPRLEHVRLRKLAVDFFVQGHLAWP